MPDVWLRFRGDPRDGVRSSNAVRDALQGVARAEKETGAASRASAQTAAAAAREKIQAAVRERAAIEAEARVYRDVARAAQRGSREQVAAANLVAQAQRKLAAATATTAREQVAYSRAADRAQAQAGKAARGALAGSGAFGRFGRSIAFTSGTFLGAAGFVAAVERSVSAASNLAEQASKTERVFGQSGKALLTWSKTTATAFGIASDQALEFASTFGSLLRPLGVAQKEAAEQSRLLVERGADLASFYNTSVKDALDALHSGVVGETEPLRRYGIILNETRVQAQALSSGLVKANVDLRKVGDANEAVAIAQARYTKALKDYGEGTTQAASAHRSLVSAQNQLTKAMAGAKPQLTDQQKVMARLQLIYKDSAIAQGDYARTSGGLAGQQKRLAAQIRDVEIGLGQALMPTILKVTATMTEWLSKTENQEKLQRKLKGAVDAFVAAAKIAFKLVQAGAKVFDTLADSVGGSENAVKLLVAALVVSKITRFTAAIAGPGGLIPNLRTLTKTPWAAKVTVTVIGLALLERAFELIGKTSAAEAARQAGFHPRDENLSLGRVVRGGQALRGKEIVIGPSGYGIVTGTTQEGYQQLKRITAEQAAKLLGVTLKQLTDRILREDASIYARAQGGISSRAQREGPGAPRGGRQLPENIASGGAGRTHDTSGLAGFPAVDIEMTPGTPVLAPERGVLSNPHFIQWDAKKRVGGWTCYFRGEHTGSTYFITHLATVGNEGHYYEGEQIGTVAAVPGGWWKPHVHVGQHMAAVKVPTGGTGTGTGGAGGGGDLVVGSKPSTAKKTPPLVAARFTDAVTVAKTAVANARTDVARDTALGREIEALLSLQDALERALPKAEGKRKEQIRKALLGVARDLKSARDQLDRDIDKQSQAARARATAVDALLKTWWGDEAAQSVLVTRGAAQARSIVSNLSTAQARAATRAAQTALAKLRRDLATATKRAAPLQGVADGLTVDVHDSFGRVVGQKTVAAIRANINRLFVAAQRAVAQAARTNTPAARAAASRAIGAFNAAVDQGFSDTQAAIDRARTRFETAFGRASSRILAGYDRQTQQTVDGMQRETQAQIEQLSRDNDRQLEQLQARADVRLRQLQDRLQAGIDRLEERRAQLTPAEQQLAAMRAARAAADAARELADAQQALADAQGAPDASTPEGQRRIVDAQRQLDDVLERQQEASLEAQAENERRALDESVDRQEEALRRKEQADEEAVQAELKRQQDALNEQLSRRTTELQAELDARVAEYQDERDAQRETLEAELAAWQENLANGSATYEQFLLWLQGKQRSGIFGQNIPDPVAAAAQAGAFQGNAFARAFVEALTVLPQAIADASSGVAPTVPSAPRPVRPPGPREEGLTGTVPRSAVSGATVRASDLVLSAARSDVPASGPAARTIVVNLNGDTLEGSPATARRFASRIATELDRLIQTDY